MKGEQGKQASIEKHGCCIDRVIIIEPVYLANHHIYIYIPI